MEGATLRIWRTPERSAVHKLEIRVAFSGRWVPHSSLGAFGCWDLRCWVAVDRFLKCDRMMHRRNKFPVSAIINRFDLWELHFTIRLDWNLIQIVSYKFLYFSLYIFRDLKVSQSNHSNEGYNVEHHPRIFLRYRYIQRGKQERKNKKKKRVLGPIPCASNDDCISQ